MKPFPLATFTFLVFLLGSWAGTSAREPLQVSTFEVDATPPLGTPISYGPAESVMDPLSCRGLVLSSDRLPIVLCAVDWLALRNGAHDAFRVGLAEAVGTSPDRVAVHVLHQHDAPSYDFDSEMLLAAHGRGFPADYCRDTIRRVAAAAKESLTDAQSVTQIGIGKGRVEQVASNRRVLGNDGNVAFSRWSSMKKAAAAEAPQGVIDPDVRSVSLWNHDKPLVVMTWYATHPQSYYTRGRISSDFVGMARKIREDETGVFHVHFNGAGGNITAGKYNNGAPAHRPVLARRLAEGMRVAWDTMVMQPLSSADMGWRVDPVSLPAAADLNEPRLVQRLSDSGGASKLAWLRHCKQGDQVRLTCLQLGPAMILHMPGELFVEYQLAAQAMRPDTMVCMAAYGDGGPGYIGTRLAYTQGGYETGSPSNVSPEVERVLTDAIQRLLRAKESDVKTPSHWTAQYPRWEAHTPSDSR